jgi:hypothetical protein
MITFFGILFVASFAWGCWCWRRWRWTIDQWNKTVCERNMNEFWKDTFREERDLAREQIQILQDELTRLRQKCKHAIEERDALLSRISDH